MLFLAMAALLIASMTFAFAASNTMPVTSPLAGEGTTTIDGYTVSSIVYTLDTSNPANITAVNFTLSAAASTVRVSFGAATTTACSVVSGNNWTCPVTAPVSSANSLTVVAAQ
jgi:hypothetical protein